MAAVMAVVRNVAPVCVTVRVRGLRRSAGILRRSQGLLARCGVRVAGGHHGRGHGLLRRSEDLRTHQSSTSPTSANSFLKTRMVI